MRLLATSHWSFARDRGLLREFRDLVETPADVALHDIHSDLDLNRTTLAVSGESDSVLTLLAVVASLALPRIDLCRHVGSHPRTGALDECTFTVAKDEPADADQALALRAAEELAEELGRFGVPTYLVGKFGRHTDSKLTGLREAGFGSLLETRLEPDFGPSDVHPQMGISMVGVRDFSLTFEARLAGQDLASARGIVSEMIALRSAGDMRFLGVDAEAYRQPTHGETLLLVSMSLPDLAPPDPLIQWILEAASVVRTVLRQAVLVGAIRAMDQPGANRLVYRPEQVAW